MTPRERSDRAFDELERAFLEALDASTEEEALVVDIARSMGMHERSLSLSVARQVARQLARKLERDGRVVMEQPGGHRTNWTVRRRK